MNLERSALYLLIGVPGSHCLHIRTFFDEPPDKKVQGLSLMPVECFSMQETSTGFATIALSANTARTLSF